MNKRKELSVKSITVVDNSDSGYRVSYQILADGAEKELWFEVDQKWSRFVVTDRCDAAVTALLYYSIRYGYDIHLDVPISEALYYQLQFQLIPHLSTAKDGLFNKIRIYPSALLPKIESDSDAVGMGMSLGVDSFATLYEFNSSEISRLERYRVTHFTYHQVGAHHGISRGKQGPLTPQELFDEDLAKVEAFCEKYQYPLIVIRSNLDELIKESFPFRPYWASYTFRNVGAVLLLQKLFSKFYFSSGFTLRQFAYGEIWDIGRADPVLLPLLSTENTRFYRSNQDWNRLEKIRLISEYEPSHDYLTICMTSSTNCGTCEKCRPTLIAMDILGVLDRYRNSFDIEKYRREHREQWLKDMWNDKKNDIYQREVVEYLIAQDYKPVNETEKGYYTLKANFRKYPNRNAVLIKVLENQRIHVLGETMGWYHIRLSDGKEGYCYKKYIRPIKNN